MYTLGIDIGSTYIKAAVFEAAADRVCFSRSVPTAARKSIRRSCCFEIEAEKLYQTVRALLEEAAAQFPVKALLLSTQMHGFVYQTEDREDTYISWQDARCTEKMADQDISYLEYLKSQIPPQWMQDCGVPLKPSLGMCNLYALLHGDNPPPADGTLYTLGSYLNVRLGGKNICHASNAAPLGLMSQKERAWHEELIRWLGFDQISLPEIAGGDFADCGRAQVGNTEIRLYPDYGDQQVSVLGAMPGERHVIINIATASQISCLSECFAPGHYESRPYFGKRYLNTVSNMPGGRNFGVLTDFLKECASVLCGRKLTTGQVWDAVNAVYHQEQPTLRADVLFYPTEHKTDGGAIWGIKPDNLTITQLFAAAYEDAAGHYERVLEELFCEKAEGITFLGGVSFKNAALIDHIAGRLGLPYQRCVMPDEALNGLYRLSLAAVGEIGDLEAEPERSLKTDEEQK